MANKRNNNIQWLRGVGILAIVLYHFPMFYKLEFIDYIQRFVRFGQANELFFVMAGYFLAAKCFNQAWNIREVMDFLKSRIRRLIAPLCVWGGTAACVGILTDRFTWEQGMAYFLTTAAFMQNIYNVYNPNNFGYAWFVACEFQFTVLFMLLMLYKNTARIIYGLVAALVLLTFYHPHFRTYLLFEFQGLIIGTLLALILKKFPYIAAEANKIPMAVRRFIVMWCIALGLAMSKVLPMDISFSVSSVFFSIGFSILLAAPYNMYGQLGRWIKKTGDISYSVYLCHIPVILLCNYIFEDSILYNCTLLYFVFVMIVIYVMSFLSHKYIESI